MPDKGLHVQQNENVDRGRLQVNVTSTLGLQPVVNARVGIAYTGCPTFMQICIFV